MVILKVNGDEHQIDVDPETPLLWVLRENLGLTGAKYSCGIGECGACTVHVDGEPTFSCTKPVSEMVDKEIVTIEGLKGRTPRALHSAWVKKDVPQCGYCQPGQIMMATTLFNKGKRPSKEDVDEAMSEVLCRCGTYNKIRDAILMAAEEL
jgi:aerobic-type carbon monoxide dehydrogenase small subunit (CoxS/CutS family)